MGIVDAERVKMRSSVSVAPSPTGGIALHGKHVVRQGAPLRVSRHFRNANGRTWKQRKISKSRKKRKKKRKPSLVKGYRAYYGFLSKMQKRSMYLLVSVSLLLQVFSVSLYSYYESDILSLQIDMVCYFFFASFFLLWLGFLVQAFILGDRLNAYRKTSYYMFSLSLAAILYEVSVFEKSYLPFDVSPSLKRTLYDAESALTKLMRSSDPGISVSKHIKDFVDRSINVGHFAPSLNEYIFQDILALCDKYYFSHADFMVHPVNLYVAGDINRTFDAIVFYYRAIIHCNYYYIVYALCLYEFLVEHYATSITMTLSQLQVPLAAEPLPVQHKLNTMSLIILKSILRIMRPLHVTPSVTALISSCNTHLTHIYALLQPSP